ncbi:MAG: hypothetical protein K2I81_03645 [Alphaproteobacteria bacterium]|nr:hypothetical protein [Alphaproteobacteria bacterium]
MDLQNILRLLQNAGFRNIQYAPGSQIISFEDPACILRSFATFAEYAWIALVCVTGLLLFGWAISMIRGAKNDIFTNLRNLILIFGIVSVVGPIINVVYGDDLFARGCKTVQVSVGEVQKLLDARNAKMSSRHDDLYEDFDIYDTGATITEDEQTTPPPPPDLEPQPDPGNSTRAISAHASGNDVIYVYQDQSRTRRTDGTRAWRNNNPGNIRPGKFTNSAGGIGQANNYAVFPDEQTGMDAIIKLLKTNSYQSKTLAGAISAWAPPSDGNNTSAYQRSVANAVGVPLDTPMRNLNDAQLSRLANEIRRVEGWQIGRETRE